MQFIHYCVLISLMAGMSAFASDLPPSKMPDSRHDLKLTVNERTEFLSEMRAMLGSVQGVVQGIANEDREAIAKFARISGNKMARATPASVRAKLPPSFQALGAPTHMAFEELGVRAQTDDMDMLTKHLGQTMNYCLACHASFKVR